MQLSYISLMIRDMEKSLAFYEELVGLRVLRRFNLGPGEIAFLANGEGETMLELIQFEQGEKLLTKGMVLSFQAEESLEALREKAIHLGYSPSVIIEQRPKPKHFTLADPDGMIVEFSI